MKRLLRGRFFLRAVLRKIGSLVAANSRALVADCHNIMFIRGYGMTNGLRLG